MAILHDAAVWTVEADGYCRMGHEWEAWVGCSPGEASGEGWLEHLHPEDRNRVADVSLQGIEAVRPFAVCFRMRFGKEWRWVRGKGIPILDATGNVVTHGVTVPLSGYLPVTEYHKGQPVQTRLFDDPRVDYLAAFQRVHAGIDRKALMA